VPEAGDEVIVDETGCLHEGITDRGADKAEAALLEVLAQGVGLRGRRRDLFHVFPAVLSRLIADEAPDVTVEAPEFFLHGEKRLGVADRGFDLETVAYDTGIREQGSDFRPAEARDPGGIESGEGSPIILPLSENGVPAQTRLCAFEDEELEPPLLIVYRHAPFVVVVGGQAVVRVCPRAT